MGRGNHGEYFSEPRILQVICIDIVHTTYYNGEERG